MLPDALDDWYDWALKQDDLTEEQQELCYGPQLSLEQYDRATIGEANFVASSREGVKFSRNSAVIKHCNGAFFAGRVRAFLSHPAPGWQGCNVEDEANIAEVEWFAPAAAAPGIDNGLSTSLNCPVFRRSFNDDPTGNMWPLERLAPCNLLTVPHHSHVDNLVVLSRSSLFLKQVPKDQ